MPNLSDLIGYDPPTDLKGVTQDAYCKVYLPANTAEFTTLLSGTPLAVPTSIWVASSASGASLPDSGSGGRTVTIAGSPTLGASAPGFASTGIKCVDNSATQYGTFTGADVNTTSQLLIQVYGLNSTATGTRYLNSLGAAWTERAHILAGNHIQAQSGAGTASGTATYSSVLVVLTKLDVTNLDFCVYTRGEQIRPTFDLPFASTTHNLFGAGAATDATFIYGAYLTGASAEITDAQAQQYIDFIYGNSTTISKMQAGSFAGKLVVAIEGCQYLLCESDTAAALSAWAGSDWTSALPGLFVELKNSQSVTAWDPFTGGGSCKISVVDTDGSDTFGVFVNKRLFGAETELTQTIDRNDTTIPVASTQDFTSSGTIYVGTEAIGYTGVTSTTFTGATRGKWSPFGCASSGSGGNRFAGHHRVGKDSYKVDTKPVVTQTPRTWLGKRVGVFLHTWDEATRTMNSRDEAQLLYAGRIAGIADDPNGFCTVIDVEPIHEEIKNGVVGRDMLVGTIAEGLYIPAGRVFQFDDWIHGVGTSTANVLTVVASGASGTNQMNAGTYTLGELCEKLSAWLAGEKAAGRINGYYSWHSPVTSNIGLRSKLYWRIENASSLACHFRFYASGEVTSFLGLLGTDPYSSGQMAMFARTSNTNRDNIAQGEAVPFTQLVFKPLGPGRIAQEFSEAISYEFEDQTGGFIDQYSALPSVIKASCDPTKPWGLWLLNETTLIVGSYDSGVISNVWLAPFQTAADKDKDATSYIGRRADEPQGGPVTIRQVFMLESSFSTMLATLIYGTGTAGYNHSTYDGLAYGFGLGIPGSMLGGDFERSLSNLPGANAPVSVVIDEPTRFTDLFSADLIIRRAFLRWKDESFEFAQWKTPVAADAVASLTESNKAAPAGHEENHRIATVEHAEDVRSVIKIDYCKDMATGRDGIFLKSVQLEDQTAVDDAGGNVKAFTIKLRNSSHDLQGSGAAIEALIPEFLAFMPAMARSSRVATRSIDMRYFEGYGVGDIVTVTDSFARDPLTGRRGIGSRPAFISRLTYDIGGPSPDGSIRPMGGDVELMFLDVHRSELYAPAAVVDDTATGSGYDAGSKMITCYAHKNSHSISVTINWGTTSRTFYIEDDADATWFEAGDAINVIEMDPANPAAPLAWSDTVAGQSGNTITLTTGLAGFDTTKKYRIVPQKYSQVVATQQDYAFQADSADRMVEDLDPFYHWGLTEKAHDYVANTGTEKAELIPTIAFGDGRPWDPGYDRAIIHGLNNAHDYKCAIQAPMLSADFGVGPISTDEWCPMFAGPVYLGSDPLSTVVTRSLRIAPFWRKNFNATGVDAQMRVTLARMKPQLRTATAEGTYPAGNFVEPLFAGEFSQTTTWTTSTTTYFVDSEKTLSIAVKDLTWGYAWLVIDGRYDVSCLGLSLCVEGPRTITAVGNAILTGVATEAV